LPFFTPFTLWGVTEMFQVVIIPSYAEGRPSLREFLSEDSARVCAIPQWGETAYLFQNERYLETIEYQPRHVLKGKPE
jgi:hypothetical protein